MSFRQSNLAQLLGGLIVCNAFSGGVCWILTGPGMNWMTGAMFCVAVWLILEGILHFNVVPWGFGISLAMVIILLVVIQQQDTSLPVWLRYGPFSAFGFLICLNVLITIRFIDRALKLRETVE
ncbi:MAG TPA: hypothetical protein DD473_00865 [Planctomycetaceae bacterium]|nr:hypothetical protein [Planctomycetaceae bacterium]|tara:strand:+ start:260 stop:628 length:369 start_codon:yes stop_codon:yes gene_type:complete